MRIVFRADASYEIGTGHIMRCLTLGDALRESGAEVVFISRELPGSLCDFIQRKNFQLNRLPCIQRKISTTHTNGSTHYPDWLGETLENDADQTIGILSDGKSAADWLIVDHYALDKQWDLQVRPYVKKIMVIDDLANRDRDCDLLLNQNFYIDPETRYEGLVPDHCCTLLGPKYALLRPQFMQARKNIRVRDGNIRQILILFGGSDPTNETAKALEGIRRLNKPDIGIDVVVGSNNSNKDRVRKICSMMPATNFHYQVDNIAQLMFRADLAIGAGGSTTWERCCMGLPSIIITVAENQVLVAKSINQINAGVYIGSSGDVTPSMIKMEVENLFKNKDLMKLLSAKSHQLVDGQGLVRLSNIILKQGMIGQTNNTISGLQCADLN